LNLLLAEDNLPDALLVREVIRLENLPLDVYAVPDGEKALEFIARSDEHEDAPHPDLLLLDLNLPKRDGFEVLKRLRESAKYGRIPVLVMTSSDAPADRARASDFGAAYFRKPPSYGEFLRLGDVLRKMVELSGKSASAS
jgi:chemotaxis family two-component system response regulator Rcp1